VILVTRLDGSQLALNSDLIVEVEACPDTTVRLLGGDSLIVRESVTDVVQAVVAFRAEILRHSASLRRASGERRSASAHSARGISAAVPGRAVQLRFLRGFEDPQGSGSPASGGTP